MTWIARILAVCGLVIVAWALITQLPGVVHGNPAYAVMLGLTVVGCLGALWLHRRRRPAPHGWRRAGSIALCAGAVGWLVATWYFRPFSAQEPALAAMQSDDDVRVTESASRVVMEPADGSVADVGVFYQPGAKVEARAYAAVLRPLAESGYRVVIIKQPLGIAFLSLGAFTATQSEYPQTQAWVLGGHSLGGTVAAIQADDHDKDASGPAKGLLLHASYPAGDISGSLSADVLSVSGTNDGLATPADIQASVPNLPEGSTFDAIEGAIHSYFGDYGPQPGDGQPTISHDEARTLISNATVAFVSELSATLTQ